MWPVHTWLPDAHVEAPTGGSVILAAITLKIGGYGLLRFALPITHRMPAMALDWFVISLVVNGHRLYRLCGVSTGGLEEIDRLFQYRPYGLCHPRVDLLSSSAFSPIQQQGSGAVLAVEGAMVQMVSHGFIAAAMFLCVGVLYDRMHTREIAALWWCHQHDASICWLFSLSLQWQMQACPVLSGFVGEFMVILAAFQANFWYAFLAATTLILGAAYSLWMIKRVVFGEVSNDNVATLKDINRREFWMLASLAIIVLVIGIWPAPLIEVMHSSVEHLLTQVSQSKL